MTRRVSQKTGRTYQVGSSSGYGGWESRACASPDCLHGGKIVKGHDIPLWFHMDDVTGEATSWHMDCWRAQAAAAAPQAALPLPDPASTFSHPSNERKTHK